MRGEASLVLDGLVAAIEHASEHGRLSGARLGLRLQTDLGGGGGTSVTALAKAASPLVRLRLQRAHLDGVQRVPGHHQTYAAHDEALDGPRPAHTLALRTCHRRLGSPHRTANLQARNAK